MSRKKIFSLMILLLILTLVLCALRGEYVQAAMDGAKKAVRGLTKNAASMQAAGASGLQGVADAITHALQSGTQAIERMLHAMLGR